jgi:hypothetical protein
MKIKMATSTPRIIVARSIEQVKKAGLSFFITSKLIKYSGINLTKDGKCIH